MNEIAPIKWRFGLFLPNPRKRIEPMELPPYDPELENITSLLSYVCSALDNEQAEFELVSPTQGKWPVDVATDLAVVVEQLPGHLRFCRASSDGTSELDLFEQGIERKILFEKSGKTLTVECLAYDGTRLEYNEVDCISWRSMIETFWNTFHSAVNQQFPSASNHPFWLRWVGSSDLI